MGHKLAHETNVVAEYVLIDTHKRLEFAIRHQPWDVAPHSRQRNPARHVKIRRQVQPFLNARRDEHVEPAAHLGIDREAVVGLRHHRRVMVMDTDGVVPVPRKPCGKRTRDFHRRGIVGVVAQIDAKEAPRNSRRLLELEMSVSDDHASVLACRTPRTAQNREIKCAFWHHVRKKRDVRPSVLC